MMMKPVVSPGCRAPLLAIALALGCAASALAQPLPLAGRWLPDDAPEAQTGAMLVIENGGMSWRDPKSSAPPCVQPFELVKERPGTVYTNARGTRFVSGSLGSLPTYLLKPAPGNCGAGAETVRINFPLVYDINHIEVLEYVNGKLANARRFHRQKEQAHKKKHRR